MVLDGFFNAMLGPVLSLPGPLGIVIISFALTLVITLLYKYMTDQEHMKSLKEEMKKMQGEMKTRKDKPDEMVKIQKELMSKNWEYFKHSMKPNLVSFIPIIIFFGWLNSYYSGLGNPVILSIGTFGLKWFWTYVIVSIVSSLLLRKLLKVN